MFDFVADERNEPRYNPRMLDAEQISEGPIGVGTRFRTELEDDGSDDADDRGVHGVRATAAPWVGDALVDDGDRGRVDVRVCPGGTRMCWSWEVRPRGALKLMAPLVGVIGRRQEQRIWGNLKRLLESGGEGP